MPGSPEFPLPLQGPPRVFWGDRSVIRGGTGARAPGLPCGANAGPLTLSPRLPLQTWPSGPFSVRYQKPPHASVLASALVTPRYNSDLDGRVMDRERWHIYPWNIHEARGCIWCFRPLPPTSILGFGTREAVRLARPWQAPEARLVTRLWGLSLRSIYTSIVSPLLRLIPLSIMRVVRKASA